MQTPAAFNPSYLDYLSSLHIESKPLNSPLSTIICTIGSSTNNTEAITDLMGIGMRVVLINMANMSRNDVQDTVRMIQATINSTSTVHNRIFPLAIALQLRPTGVHIGAFDKGTIKVEVGNQIVLTTNQDWKNRGNANTCYFDLPNAADVLHRGDKLLMDTGAVVFNVDDIFESKIICVIESGGQLTSNMKVSIPGVPLHLAAVTKQDEDDLEFIASMSSVDMVVVTSVRTADHSKEVRKILKEYDRGGIMVFSRIDSKIGLERIEEIARESDGIVLARNELATEIQENKLFLAQKIVISTCNKMGKPVYITANYMESMIDLPVSTRYAEIIDVQSAILDGADGIILDNTTAQGHFPSDTMRAVTGICAEAEAAVWQSQVFNSLLSLALPPMDPTHAISISAVEASLKSCAAAIILATTSGRSAQLVARYRPRCHIIAITRYGQVARQLNAWRAVLPVHYVTQPLRDWNKEVDIRLQMGIEFGKEKGLIRAGDPIVLVNGWRQGAGFTNTLRVVYASDSDPWVYPHTLPLNTNITGFEMISRGISAMDPGVPSSVQKTSIDSPRTTKPPHSITDSNTTLHKFSMGGVYSADHKDSRNGPSSAPTNGVSFIVDNNRRQDSNEYDTNMEEPEKELNVIY